jgi:iron complex outermembrane receptor protein
MDQGHTPSGAPLRRALHRASSHRSLMLALAGFGLAFSGAPAFAQTTGANANAPVNLDLGAVLSTASESAAMLQETPGTAPYVAPSLTPLNESQPTSVVNRNAIQDQLTSTGSFADIAKLTPSVSAVDPNGPGLQEAVGPTIRGFSDGQYNVTFDGIPIGDSNDFTHHSTSFFTNDEIGQEIVDRGPGTAETVGDATFGGTISIRTINPAPSQTLTPYGEFGSYDTSVAGLRYDTGAIRAANGTTAVFNAEHIQSNGALQNAGQERSNFFGKVVVPVNNSTTVTLVIDYNKLYQNPAIGATLQEMQAYGRNFAYTTDPNQQNYNRYNNDRITTDLEYADIESNLGNGWLYDGKVYTFAYYHEDLNGDDPNDQGLPGQFSNATLEAAGAIPNLVQSSPNGPLVPGIPGETFKNSWRSVGTIQRAQKDFSFGDIKAGFWFDHQVNTREVSESILTAGNAPDYAPTDSNGGALVDRLQHNQLYTFQPYAQFDWRPISGLTLTSGVKYAFFKRALNAPVNQGTQITQGYEHNYTKLLPSFEAKYSFSPNLSAYAQAAEGFLAPNLNTYYTKNITTDSLKPQSTLNFQTGAAYQGRHLAVGGDVYLIHFQNYINSKKVNGQKVFYNNGGVIYRGIEGDVTYTFDSGFSLFANGGYNQAFQTSTNNYITNAPQFTSNLGILYSKNGFFGSVIDQWTGGSYTGDVPSFAGDNIDNGHGKAPGEWYDPYNVVNLMGGYTFNHLNPHLSQVKLKLNVDNITNQRQIITDNGTNALGQNLYFVLPGVSVFATITVPINF